LKALFQRIEEERHGSLAKVTWSGGLSWVGQANEECR
jgi:hypothetical protein